jgi:hypothetical protein
MSFDLVLMEVVATRKSFALALPLLARETAPEMRFPAVVWEVMLVTTVSETGMPEVR